jgi:GalNAc-alpha-(1->4)-GalNAc-alpha-(1->3)-diNAcBac-PP-undecaprenol alpha-1,4-N-acetyl-D-galactosaminyltransferase
VRLTLVISSLTSGGAERIMAGLANDWAAHGHHVTLITLARSNDDRYSLVPAVTRVGLDMLSPSGSLWQAARSNWRRLKRLRHEILRSQPDAVVSFLSETNVLTLAATRALGLPVIVSERVDPMAHRISTLWASLRDLLYRRASAVVVQTHEVARWAERRVPVKSVHIIPNPVPPPNEPPESRGEAVGVPEWLADPRHKVFAVGRLTRQKGFDLLMEAFAHCHRQYSDWTLVILGEGEERRRLEELAVQLGIESAVRLPGYVPDVPRVLRQADIFVLSSRYEGFPNALLEAMACGIPVISTDCPSGPRDIVRHGLDGLLIPPDDVPALSAAMRQLIAAPEERRRLGSRAAEVTERFSVAGVRRRWNDLLLACTATQ